MTKKELDKVVAQKTEITLKKAGEVSEAIFEEIADCIKKGDSITIKGFGTFDKVHRKERKGKNPQTGESMIIAACDVPKFKASSVLKEKCNCSE